MPAITGWRVWYADGSVRSSAETTWQGLPKDGVLGVRVYEDGTHPNGRPLGMVLQGQDYYFRALSERGVAFIGSTMDTPANIHRRYPGACILAGKWTDNEFFEAVTAEMQRADDPPPDGPGA